MNDEFNPADLAQRFRTLGDAAAERPAAPLRSVHRRADQRRHRRRMAIAVAPMAALVGAGAFAFSSRSGDDGGQLTAGQVDTTTTLRDSGSSTSVPDVGSSTQITRTVTGGYVIDHSPDVDVYDASGQLVATYTPYPDREPTQRARAQGTALVVRNNDGTEATIIDLVDGSSRVVTLDRAIWTDVWGLGGTGDSLAFVWDDYDVASATTTLYRTSLVDGTSTVIATDTTDAGLSTPTVADDGTVIVTTCPRGIGCHYVRFDSDGTRHDLDAGEPSEPAITPDGTSIFDLGPNGGVVRYDAVTGEQTGEWLTAVTPQLEGFQIDTDGTQVLLSNSYDDADHGPWVLLDTATGTTTDLPVNAPASFWG